MKIIKTAKGNEITMSKSEWKAIGKTAGWDWDEGDDLQNFSDQQAWEDTQADIRSMGEEELRAEGICPECREKTLNIDYECMNPACEAAIELDLAKEEELPEGF